MAKPQSKHDSQQDSCRRKNAEGQDVEARTSRAQKTQLVPHRDEISTDGSEAELEQEMGPLAAQVTSAMQVISKPDAWPREFWKEVKSKQDTVVKLAEGEVQKVEHERRRFEENFLALVNSTSVNCEGNETLQNRPTNASPDPRGHPLFSKCSVLLEESRKLIAQYGSFTHMPATQSPFVELQKKLQSDYDKVQYLIRAGRNVSQADIQALLEDKYHYVRSRQALYAEEEKAGRNLLSLGQDQKAHGEDQDGASWAQMAQKLHKAVGKLHGLIEME